MKKIIIIAGSVILLVAVYFSVKYLHMASVMVELDRLPPEKIEEMEKGNLSQSEDYNFDGYPDKIETEHVAGANFSKKVYIYNPQKKEFEFNKDFSDVLSGSESHVNSELKTISLSSQDGYLGWYLREYRVVDNKPVMISEKFTGSDHMEEVDLNFDGHLDQIISSVIDPKDIYQKKYEINLYNPIDKSYVFSEDLSELYMRINTNPNRFEISVDPDKKELRFIQGQSVGSAAAGGLTEIETYKFINNKLTKIKTETIK